MTALPTAPGPAASAPSGRVPAAAGRVLPALVEASRRTGVPFDALFQTARLESGFDPDARARTSSATGLFQFIDSTWLKTLARHGARHGLAPATREEALGLRRDPYAASLMAAHHIADNAAVLSARTGRAPGQVELYLAHFLGAGGAADFLEGLAATPDRPAAELMPAAARANRSIFFAGGKAQSLAEVYERFARKLGAEPSPGTHSLPSLQTAEASGNGVVQNVSAGQPNALHTARLAYLLLADLGA
jgi:hypothetical protein